MLWSQPQERRGRRVLNIKMSMWWWALANGVLTPEITLILFPYVQCTKNRVTCENYIVSYKISQERQLNSRNSSISRCNFKFWEIYRSCRHPAKERCVSLGPATATDWSPVTYILSADDITQTHRPTHNDTHIHWTTRRQCPVDKWSANTNQCIYASVKITTNWTKPCLTDAGINKSLTNSGRNGTDNHNHCNLLP